jgi:hypothetical protein
MTRISQVELAQARTGTPIDHFSCCEAKIGMVEPMLCGVTDLVDVEAVDEVSCVVCTGLEHSDICPRHGLCPYRGH